MELLAVLRRGNGLEAFFQASGVLGEESSRRREEPRVVVEPEPQTRKRLSERLVEGVELLAEGFGPGRLVAVRTEPLREMGGAALRVGLELSAPLRQPLHLDLEVPGGVRRSRELREPGAELLLRRALQIRPVGADDASQPPQGDAKVMEGLFVLAVLEPPEGFVRLLEEAEAEMPRRLLGRSRQQARIELDHGIRTAVQENAIIAVPKSA